MPVRNASPGRNASPARTPSPFTSLLAGASVLTLIAACQPAAARNILSKGGTSAVASTAASALASAQQAATALQQATNALSIQTRVIAAAMAAQSSARNLALAATNLGGDPNHPGKSLPDVANGLQAGGLVPDSGLVRPGAAKPDIDWTNAATPVETTAGGQTTVTIKQTAQKALLNWSRFNVGRDTTVYFNQQGGATSTGNTWVALNQITDPTDRPSQILGRIKADGSVYLIDQNGILFGGASQINVYGLVASTLAANPLLVTGNILTPGYSSQPAFSTQYNAAPGAASGAITVQAGAAITTDSGGRLFLIGDGVTNAGTLSAPSGQIILASASDQVFLTPNSNTADTSLRGLIAGVGAGGAVVNDANAIISAPTGDVMMVGRRVNQLGVAEATTSVNYNGTIDLLAEDGASVGPGGGNQPQLSYAADNTGTLTLGGHSATVIANDGSGATAPASQSFTPSSFSLIGDQIRFLGDALVLSPGADLRVDATANNGQPASSAGDGSRIYIDSNVILDVAGSENVTVPIASQIVTVNLRAIELADSPLQREGAIFGSLYGKTITVDARVSGVRSDGSTWVGTPFANVSDDVTAALSDTVGQLTVKGGSVSLLSGGDVIERHGAVINNSGGWINYTGGYIDTTRLVGADGHLYAIAQADPGVDYVGICCNFSETHPHWGVTQTFGSTLSGGYYAPGYVAGADAGNVYIIGADFSLGGGLLDLTVDAGPYGRAASNRAFDSQGVDLTADVVGVAYYAAAGGDAADPASNTAYSFNSIVIGNPAAYPEGAASAAQNPPPDLGTNADVVIDSAATSLPTGFTDTTPLPVASRHVVVLPAGWFTGDVTRHLSIASNGSVTLPAGATLDLGPAGALTVRSGDRITIDGDIFAPGGSVTLLTGITTPAPQIKTSSRAILLGANATVDLAGLWVNDALDIGATSTGPIQTNGGSLSISAGDGVALARGSAIDVSGGAWVSSANKLTVGNGGSVSIADNADWNENGILGNPGESNADLLPVLLDGAITGYGVSATADGGPTNVVGAGGALSLTVGSLSIDRSIGDRADLQSGGAGGAVAVTGAFFQAGGFTSYAITGIDGVTIAAHAVIAPRAADLVLSGGDRPYFKQPGGASVESFATIETIAPTRRDPTSISLATSFSGQTANDQGTAEIPGASIVMQAGSAISTDPGASVSLKSNYQLTILGTIDAPGGAITLVGAPPRDDQPFDNTESVWIGAGASLSAAGVAVTYADPTTGLVSGSVMNGGSVTISATGGFVNLQQGATIDVSGTSGAIDIPAASSPDALPQSRGALTTLSSNGGAISITATSGVFLDGTLTGRSGGPTSSGGSLSVTIQDAGSQPNQNGPFEPISNRKLIVRQSGLSPLAGAALKPGQALDDTIDIPEDVQGTEILFESFGPLYGKAYVSADQVETGGFSSLSLASLQGAGGATSGQYYRDIPANFITYPNGTVGPNPTVSVFLADSILFAGNVSLSLNNSLSLTSENFSIDPGHEATVSLKAPTIAFGGEAASNVWGFYPDPYQAPSATYVVAGHGGTLTLTANDIDIYGKSSIDRFGAVDFNSSGDIRLVAQIADYQAIEITGALTLRAAQVYGTTVAPNIFGQATAVLFSDTSLTIDGDGAVPQTPISAGAVIDLYAPVINQDGVLRAPLGQLTIGCTADSCPVTEAFNTFQPNQYFVYAPTAEAVNFGPGSVTSVSLDGQIVPYGTVNNGLAWTGPDGQNLVAPQDKVLTVSANAIKVDKGATVDESGGGDLYAYEFIAGLGGSTDVLAAANSAGDATVFAINPSYHYAYAPIDTAQSPTDGLTLGRQVYLSGGDGLAAGYYTLLPAHYALLPGGYAISVVSGSSGFLAQQNTTLTNGSAILSGWFATANTPFRSQISEAFQVTPGAVVRTESQFTDYTASSFFATQAQDQNQATPPLPIDAGSLALDPVKALSTSGTFDFAPATGGVGGNVSIQAPEIAILGPAETAPAGYIGLSSSQISTFDATTLTIGGTAVAASASNSDATYNASSSNILVDNAGAPLTAPQIILLAQTAITVDAGSVIQASGSAAAPSGQTLVQASFGASSPNTAFLQVTSGAPSQILAQSPAPGGVIAIANGATIAATGGLQVYAGALTVGDRATISAPSIVLTSSQINLGGVPAHAIGFDLTGRLLTALGRASSLTLRSFGLIDFFGGFTAGSVDAAGAYTLQAVTLDAAGLVETEVAGSSGAVSITAQNLTFTDTSGAASAAGAPKSGAAGMLSVDAGEITLGSPDSIAAGMTVAGFAQTALTAPQIVFRGAGQFAVGGDLTLTTSRITGAVVSANPVAFATNPEITTPVDQTISATGKLTIDQPATPAALPPASALSTGDSVTIRGASVFDDGVIVLPASNLNITATSGGIEFAAQSSTDVSGFAKQYNDVTEYAPGGQIALLAQGGDIRIDSGAYITVAAPAGGGDGGSFTASAATGQLILAGTLVGNAGIGGAAANVTIETGSLADLTQLDAALDAGGFTGNRSIRVRSGDLTLTGDTGAHHFMLEADQGSIDVIGTIDADSATDGEILLAAGGDITLESGSQLLARSSDSVATAGSVTLETTSGRLHFDSGSTIDVSGGGYVDGLAVVRGGSVLLRAPQIGQGVASVVTEDDSGNPIAVSNGGYLGTGVAIDRIGSAIVGARSITAEAVITYTVQPTGGAGGEIGDSLIANLATDTAAFMAEPNAAAIVAALGESANWGGANSLFHLAPGIEIDSPGNLTLIADWDFHSWKYGPQGTEPGILTLRAAGDLTIAANITDGFHDDGTANGVIANYVLDSVPSWSYRLVGGADLIAANPMTVQPDPAGGTTGNFELTTSAYPNPPDGSESMYLIRTGAGFIQVAAQNDVLLDGDIDYLGPNNDQAGLQSTIYTAGVATPALPGFTAPGAGAYPTNFDGVTSYPVFYPTDGGSISITAGGNIAGPVLQTNVLGYFGVNALQFIYQWFYTEGSLNPDLTFSQQTTWWTNFSQFFQGIGALGGGDISLSAAGTIRSLGVVIPTTGRVTGGISPGDPPSAANLIVQGGGDLSVRAGGDLQDDLFFVGKGTGTIDVGGSVLAPTSDPSAATNASFGTSLALGDSHISLRAGGDLVIEQILDPTDVFTGSPAIFGASNPESLFANYTASSTLTLESLGGNLTYLGTNSDAPLNDLPVFNPSPGLGLLPPTTSLIALQGDISIDSSVTELPAPRGQLDILASGAINIGTPFQNAADLAQPANILILQAGIDPANVPGVTDPNGAFSPLSPGLDGPLLHAGDPQPNHIYALTGDIIDGTAGTAGLTYYADFVLAKPSEIEAGRDINDIGIIGQNNAATDVTSVIAGRDITYDVVDFGGGPTPILGEYASFLPDSNNGAFGVELGGPGTLVVQAGRNIELAASNGVITYGDSVDPYLPATGATIVATAGGAPDYADFISRYIDPANAGLSTGDYLPELAQFMTGQLGTGVATDQAWALYQKLPAQQQDIFARQVYFEILRDTADPALPAAYKKYSNGYDAAKVLFPGVYSGDIDLFYSEIETQNGGGIQLLAPGGEIIAGFPHPPELSNNSDLQGADKTAAQLGIFTVSGGAIDSFSAGSVLVNQSRIFTDNGGDIVIWSSDGDINAGKGAKSAQSAPPPLEEIDSSGDVISIPSGAATGSGIAILELPSEHLFNSEYLIAPHGVVDAGDAGLRATGNINIVALQVLHVDNIQAGGTVTGIPRTAPNIGALTTASNVSGAATQVAAALANNATNPNDLPSIITVQVVGYGGGDNVDLSSPEEKRRRAAAARKGGGF